MCISLPFYCLSSIMYPSLPICSSITDHLSLIYLTSIIHFSSTYYLSLINFSSSTSHILIIFLSSVYPSSICLSIHHLLIIHGSLCLSIMYLLFLFKHSPVHHSVLSHVVYMLLMFH